MTDTEKERDRAVTQAELRLRARVEEISEEAEEAEDVTRVEAGDAVDVAETDHEPEGEPAGDGDEAPGEDEPVEVKP